MQSVSASSQYEDLVSSIDKTALEALNSNPSFPPENALILKDSSFLQSDSDDPQLLINIGFNQTVKIHHFLIKGGSDPKNNPKTLKFFVNQVGMDFSRAEHDNPIQVFELSEKDFGKNIELKFVKFQSVKDITIFVEENHGGETTQISQLSFYGVPTQATDMKNFKAAEEES